MEEEKKHETEELKKEPKHKKELEKLLEENQVLNDKNLRLQAELQNFKRRTEEEFGRVIKYANADLMIEMLPALDNFERALNINSNTLSEEVNKTLDGIKMIHTSLKNTLEKFGLKEIEALDKSFDPNYHEAIMTGEDKTKDNDIILSVLQKGYLLNEKVIRPAMVKVNKLERKGEDKNE